MSPRTIWSLELLEERRKLAAAAAPTGAISGAVYVDLTANGAFDVGDTGVEGVTVFVDANGNGKLGARERRAMTDATGAYAITGLKAGRYTLRQVLPTGYRADSAVKLRVRLAAAQSLDSVDFRDQPTAGVWSSFAGDAQHTANAGVASQPLEQIRWQTPVDLEPQYLNENLYAHYGSPLFTGNNVMVLPVKTTLEGGFEIQGRRGSDGALLWTVTSDYVMPEYSWTLPYGPCLTVGNRVYFPTAGGTISYFDNADEAGEKTVHRIAFYGDRKYAKNKAELDAHVTINTPLTIDDAGNLYFGVQSDGETSLFPQSGIARISASGAGRFIAAAKAADDAGIGRVSHNAAPALSNDGKLLYVAVRRARNDATAATPNYLLALNSKTLAPVGRAGLFDPVTGLAAAVSEASTACPTVGPDGDVYYGVLDNGITNHYRGWLLHYDRTLTQLKTPGAYGWDDTASIVPASMVPSYTGDSTYLLMTKYNNSLRAGGDGVNKLAILDPNATQTDPISGATTMLEVLTIASPTPDGEVNAPPGAVEEWCINTAVVDPFTGAVLVNCEDGKMYRWDLASNLLTEVVTLTGGLGEGYTPTVVGPDGTVYAINRAVIFALGRASNLATFARF